MVGKIPEILVDNTDRNRTSPFAFTGDKFEIRSVGSHANCAETMIALNTMVANQFREFKKEIDTLTKENNMKKDDAIFNVLREYIKQSKNILFDGDGYSSEWDKGSEKKRITKSEKHSRSITSRIG